MERAYSPPSRAEVPADFLRQLRKNEKALAFFKTLNRANIYSVVFRLENAKSGEARKTKIAQIVKKFREERRSTEPFRLPLFHLACGYLHVKTEN